MSFTNKKYDSCFMKDYQKNNKSIFDHVVDTARFQNKNECNNYTAPFLTYIPSGIPNINVDIENELKGINKPITKCSECKYHPDDTELVQKHDFTYDLVNVYPNNKKECERAFNILPNGYLQRK